jgi:hypothetical protein
MARGHRSHQRARMHSPDSPWLGHRYGAKQSVDRVLFPRALAAGARLVLTLAWIASR